MHRFSTLLEDTIIQGDANCSFFRSHLAETASDSIVIRQTTLISCTTTEQGGAIYINDFTNATIHGCSFIAAKGYGDQSLGGAVYLKTSLKAVLSLSNSLFTLCESHLATCLYAYGTSLNITLQCLSLNDNHPYSELVGNFLLHAGKFESLNMSHNEPSDISMSPGIHWSITSSPPPLIGTFFTVVSNRGDNILRHQGVTHNIIRCNAIKNDGDLIAVHRSTTALYQDSVFDHISNQFIYNNNQIIFISCVIESISMHSSQSFTEIRVSGTSNNLPNFNNGCEFAVITNLMSSPVSLRVQSKRSLLGKIHFT